MTASEKKPLAIANLSPSWQQYLKLEFDKPYMDQLNLFLDSELKNKKTIYPEAFNYFNAFNRTPFEKVKVVILGQDPYHGQGQAHGLAFSVPKGVSPPPSLKNIFKEIESDLGRPSSVTEDLSPWADQGVLLLNSVLTVEMSKAGAHQNRGWEIFTNRVVEILNVEKASLVFMLWGTYAQKKGSVIDRSKHLVLESVHPSPLSSYRGFFGSKPFSKTNSYLRKNGAEEINW